MILSLSLTLCISLLLAEWREHDATFTATKIAAEPIPQDRQAKRTPVDPRYGRDRPARIMVGSPFSRSYDSMRWRRVRRNAAHAATGSADLSADSGTAYKAACDFGSSQLALAKLAGDLRGERYACWPNNNSEAVAEREQRSDHSATRVVPRTTSGGFDERPARQYSLSHHGRQPAVCSRFDENCQIGTRRIIQVERSAHRMTLDTQKIIVRQRPRRLRRIRWLSRRR